MVKVKLEMLTLPPETMLTLSRFRSAPVVPTEPSHNAALPAVTTRNHAAVPVAFAEESAVIALAVATPADAAPNAGEPSVSSANRVPAAAESAFAGCDPE
jgi:hypothetical protein